MTEADHCGNDGIDWSVDRPSCHAIDLPDFWKAPFTPFAVYDPGAGTYPAVYEGGTWREATPDEIALQELGVGVLPYALAYRAEDRRTAFIREKQRIRVLQALFPGYEQAGVRGAIGDDGHPEEPGVPNGLYSALDPTRAQATLVFRTATLQWRTGSGTHFATFPEVIVRYDTHLTPQASWTIAWCLVRASYLDRTDILDGAATAFRDVISVREDKDKIKTARARAALMKASVEPLAALKAEVLR